MDSGCPLASLPAGTDGTSQALKNLDGGVPVDTTIRNTLTIYQRLIGDKILATTDQIAFYHDTKDAFVALLDLDGKVVGNDGLTAVVLVAVGVADVNHDAWRQPGLAKPLCGCLDVFRRIIGRFPAPQDDVAVFVSTSGNNGRVPPLGYRQEVMRLGSRLDGINGDANAAAGTVLEPYRAGKPRSQLTVDLTFGRACANG